LGNNNKKRHPIKSSIIIALGTFIVSVMIFIASEIFLRSVAFLLGLILLIIIILMGIIFDIIGVAVAAAQESALNAKASKKIPGAWEGVYLKKNADKVASFCNDVVGDISGTLSGSVGAALVFQLLMDVPNLNKLMLSALMAGLVASLTVGGKALAKGYAIDNSSEIIFLVGKLIKKVEDFIGLNFFR
jgi:CBS domain containing-hemolysin-like protein